MTRPAIVRINRHPFIAVLPASSSTLQLSSHPELQHKLDPQPWLAKVQWQIALSQAKSAFHCSLR